jgi:hypothetical protein
MTWKEFKDSVEVTGIQDSDEIDWLTESFAVVKAGYGSLNWELSTLVAHVQDTE